MEYSTLAGKIVEAARLRRIGGVLRFNDELIPVGAEGCLVHTDSDRSSFVLADSGGLVPVYTTDINDQTFGYLSDLNEDMAGKMFQMFRKREVIVGQQLKVGVGTFLRRLGQPFISSSLQAIEEWQVITISAIVGDQVWHDWDTPRAGSFHPRYLTDAYFRVEDD
jgi:hypothetical protein